MIITTVGRKCFSLAAAMSRSVGSCASTNANVYRDPIRQVFISQSNDIFTNLALEDWLYRNHDFDHKSLLLLWRNDPCVVIGRHQNPWTESNVPFLRETYTKLARRNSGGGTVYHDLGNLNCTFFTRRSSYDRRRNLDVVCRAVSEVLGGDCDVRVNGRDDIVVHERKVSGTAAKLGPKSAYHHCTVLVDVNECVLHDALRSEAEGVESRATQSVRVPVENLARIRPDVTVAELQAALGWQFLKTDVDGEIVQDLGRQRGFQLVRPEEVWFPGLDKLKGEFESKQWIFGKTPKFRVKRSFPVPNHPDAVLNIELEVVSGKVETVKVGATGETAFETMELASFIQGLEFGPDLPRHVSERMQEAECCNMKAFMVGCLRSTVSKFA